MTPSPKKKPASDEESGEDFAADLDNVSADEDEPEDEEDAPKKRKVSLSILHFNHHFIFLPVPTIYHN